MVEATLIDFYLPVGLGPSFVSAFFLLRPLLTEAGYPIGWHQPPQRREPLPENRSLACRCGATRWSIGADAPGTHVECYCADCQAFARHLKAEDWLDAASGTELFQTLPHAIRFTAGQENLRLLRLSPKGLMRWYAGCCGTPIANTLASPTLPFVGMALRPGQTGFGPVVTHANVTAALGPVRQSGILRAVFDVLSRAAKAKLTGRRQNPFFGTDGTPVVQPKILTLDERNAARPPAKG